MEKVFPRVAITLKIFYGTAKTNTRETVHLLLFLSFIASVCSWKFACICIKIMNETEQKYNFSNGTKNINILYMKANHTQKKL